MIKTIIAIEEVEIINITLIKPIPPLSITPGNTWIVNASKINRVNKTTKWADNLTSFSLVSIVPRISKINPKAPGISAVIEVVAGQDSGKVFNFTTGNISIGRRHGDVPLGDVEVSRHHAVIELFGRDMIYLRDLGSTNGTYHNGRRVGTARIQAGDTVGCGKTVMKLAISG